MVDVKAILSALANMNPMRIKYGQDEMILELIRDMILSLKPEDVARDVLRIACRDRDMLYWATLLIKELCGDKECAKKFFDRVVSGGVCRGGHK